MKKAISSNNYAKLISWLKDARVSKGLTMRDLAKLLDEPHSVVQNVESMNRRLDVYEYTVYCKALGLNPIKGIKFFDEDQ